MDHRECCAFCQNPTPAAELDHVDVPRGAVPICFGCLGELNEWADACREASIAHQESTALPWEDAYAANDSIPTGKVA